MAIIRPSSAPKFQVKRQGGPSSAPKLQVMKKGGKSNGQKGGVGGAKGGSRSGKGGNPSFGGGKGGKGGKGGGSAGQWMFVPAAQVPAFSRKGGQKFGGKGGQRFGGKGGQRFSAPVRAVSKGGKSGKGGKGGKGGQDGKGGKHANQNPKQRKALDKLRSIEAECKVWVGGLDKEVTRGRLYAHFKDSVKPHLFEVMSKGTACVAFKTAEDAQSAIDTLNGSDLDGKEIQVDVWTQMEKKERKEGEPREKREKKQKLKSVLKTSFLKGTKGNKVESKIAAKIKGIESTLKVWVGGLSEKTTWKQLKQHFVDSGCEVDMCDLMGPGKATCTFKTEDEVSIAVGNMNGTELDGNTIKVEVWGKKKTKKEEA